MGKASGKHLFHTCIIIRSLHPFDFKFTVITSFRLSFFVNDHRTNGFKSTDIGNIVRFHSFDSRQSKPFFHLMNSANCSAFFTFDPLSVLIQNHLCILFRQFHQFLFRSFLWNADIDSLFSSGSQPFFYDLSIFYFLLQHNFSRDEWCARIELLHKT